jgi:hypothetical protein
MVPLLVLVCRLRSFSSQKEGGSQGRSVVKFSDLRRRVGEEVLSWLARIGGEFVAENCYPRHVCERLHLPMARKRVGVQLGQCNGVRRRH